MNADSYPSLKRRRSYEDDESTSVVKKFCFKCRKNVFESQLLDCGNHICENTQCNDEEEIMKSVEIPIQCRNDKTFLPPKNQHPEKFKPHIVSLLEAKRANLRKNICKPKKSGDLYEVLR